MNSLVAVLVAFISGALYEACCVLWVHHAERGHPFRVATISMVCAACHVAGIGSSIARWYAALAYVLGYGVGSYLGVVIAKRKRTS